MVESQHLSEGQPGPSADRADLILRPFRTFARLEAAGGILIIVSAVAALIWANSPWFHTYANLWEKTYLSLQLGDYSLSMSILHWINDLVMAVFFLLVGLEIKREILVGELASVKKAALPIAAAIGGMLVPAAIFAAINAGQPTLRGWGIPMATDIAFALGVLMLLGGKTPLSLKVFLASLAIVDDIGALLVIAMFYTEQLRPGYLLAACGILALLVLMNWLGSRSVPPYLLIGGVLWFLVFSSGVHATIAGVLLAMTIPARSKMKGEQFLKIGRQSLDMFEQEMAEGDDRITANAKLIGAVFSIRRVSRNVATPLQRVEHALHPWVVFSIVPMFALANAGVSLSGNMGELVLSPVALGVVLGLVLGKPIGIALFCWLSVSAGIAILPSGVTWRHILGVACLAGIGFTMSLFIAQISFSDTAFMEPAKLGILMASLFSGFIGLLILWHVQQKGTSGPPSSNTH